MTRKIFPQIRKLICLKILKLAILKAENVKVTGEKNDFYLVWKTELWPKTL